MGLREDELGRSLHVGGHRQRAAVGTIEIYTEHANLFPLAIDPIPHSLYAVTEKVRGRTRERLFLSWQEPGLEIAARPHLLARALKRLLVASVRAAGLKVSRDEDFILDTRRRRRERDAPFLVPVPAYRVRVLNVDDDLYLCLNHHLVLKNADHLARLRQFDPSLVLRPSQRVYVQDDTNGWVQGRFVAEAGGSCRVAVVDEEGNDIEVIAPPELVLPELGHDDIVQLAQRTGARTADLERRLKERALLTVSQPAEARLQLAVDFAAHLAALFPLREGAFTISLDPSPARLAPPRFALQRNLSDPVIALDREDASRRSGNILEGLSRYGSYEKPGTAVRLALVAPAEQLAPLRALVDRLNRGGDRYTGAGATFGVQFEATVELVGDQQSGYDSALRELVRRPDAAELDVVLAYVPKGANTTRHDHPYFLAKKLLLREGIPSQMVDQATLINPRWKDLNLALNLFAKAGYTPWVLDEGIDDVDLFIGLSYSTTTVRGRPERMMAYVNVFDRYGRWRLYQSDAETFPFAERVDHLGVIVSNSLAAYRARNPGERLRTVHIHYTKKFSHTEMRLIAEAIQRELPGAQVAFVSVNMQHPLRLFDVREDRAGVIDRATYLPAGPKRLYLATTGGNPWGFTGMGTPVPLELTVWTEPATYRPSMQAIAQHVLALTRLNWASTRPFAREPITTKFAGEIAYKLGAFMEDPSFRLNPRLRDRPWFL